jgi:hypothetical protein
VCEYIPTDRRNVGRPNKRWIEQARTCRYFTADQDDDVIFKVNKNFLSTFFFNAGQFVSLHFSNIVVTYAAFALRLPDLFL